MDHDTPDLKPIPPDPYPCSTCLGAYYQQLRAERAEQAAEVPPTPPPRVRAGLRVRGKRGKFWQQCRRCSTWWNDTERDETPIGMCPRCTPPCLAAFVRPPATWQEMPASLDERINLRRRYDWCFSPPSRSVRESRFRAAVGPGRWEQLAWAGGAICPPLAVLPALCDGCALRLGRRYHARLAQVRSARTRERCW